MRYLLILFTFFQINCLIASHIVGGEIFYDYLGANKYKVSIVLYRDCNSTGAVYDNPLSLGIFSNTGTLLYNELISFPGSTNVPITFSNPCVTPPNDICIEKAIYTTILDLPPRVGGYSLAYQRCCRGPNVINLLYPDKTGLTLMAHIPGLETNFQQNSSPRFTGYPPTLLCNNEELVFNHSAIDPDGDILVYSLVPPNSGASDVNPAPNPPPSPPYNPVVWLNGFTTNNPLGNGASISIDPNTGLLKASPKMLGLFVVGIRVQEFRNGVLVGETIRDFLFRVINCVITLKAEIPLQTDMSYFISYCQGLTVKFDNKTFGATNYLWDFGVSNSNSDISTQFEPSFTYPIPGTYQVTLIANPGWPCSDTSKQTMIVNELLQVSFKTNDSICIIGNSFNFDGQMIGPNSTTFNWDFGPYASVQTSTSLDVNNVTFNRSGFIPISLKGYIGTCTANFKDSIYIFPLPTVDFSPPPNYLCEGLSVKLINQSLNTIQYKWDFGDPSTNLDLSNLFEPTYTYSTPGNYTVRLIGSSDGQCIDTSYKTLIMNEVLDVWFTNNDSLCITGNSFNFDGSMKGSPTTTFSWDFGSNASIQTASTLDVNGVSFNKPGTIPITLTGNYANCIDKQTSTLFIYKEPEVDFEISPGLQCIPFNAQFINLSSADAPLSYYWTFGEGGSSTVKNPSYLYDSVGVYDVSLTIYASKGCTDTISKLRDDYIVVHPSPISNFQTDKLVADICHSEIEFFDLSQGSKEVYYSFDGTAFSDLTNPIYSFTESGVFTPIQIATNEYLCTDTSTLTLYIEPFSVFIPNAFTPDGNEYNNLFRAVSYFDIKEWEFSIYNRWGEIIFYSTDVNEGWDGFYKNKRAQDGLYNYQVRYVSCEKTNFTHELRGHFSLIK